MVDSVEKMSSGGLIKSNYHIKAALFAVQYWGFDVVNSVKISGHPIVQLVEALRNKPEGRGFDSRWFH